MERKLGEVFTCNGKLYQVVKGFSCNGCAFIKNGNCYLDDKLLGPCAYTERTDKTSIIFKLINNMERKLGETFQYEGKTYQVVKGNTCKDCAFYSAPCHSLRTLAIGSCTPGGRKDKLNIIFKLINNVEIKNNQLTIDIPEGTEIDLENSDLSKGIIKFKQSTITYEDILQAYTIEYGSLVVSSRNIDKLLAVSKLMDIAKYYNKNWKPNWSNSKENKFCIKFDYHKDRFYVDYNNSIGAGDVFFKNSEDARTVINNPNFRDILDTIYKD